MLENYLSQDLKEGEKVVKVVHKHWASFIWPATKVFLVLVIPFFLISFLFSNLLGLIIFFIWVAVGLGYGFHQWINWYFDIFILTNQRIVNIDQRSLFSRSVSETNYKDVTGVTYEVSGPLAMMFNYGNVKVSVGGAENAIKINSVADPKGLQELIVDLQQKFVNEQEVSAQELVELISQAKSGSSNFLRKNLAVAPDASPLASLEKKDRERKNSKDGRRAEQEKLFKRKKI
jgi:hypothetical protein